MSRIRHACTCGHEAGLHASAAGGKSWNLGICACCSKGSFTPGEPMLIETYTQPGGDVEARFYGPGERRNAGTVHSSVECDCVDCRALAEQVTR